MNLPDGPEPPKTAYQAQTQGSFPANNRGTASLPPLDRRVLELPVASQKIATIRQKIAELESQSLRSLTVQLEKVYQAEVDIQEKDRLQALEPIAESAREHARRAIDLAFQQYAATKGPALAQLAVYAGFPDPGPRPNPNPDRAPSAWFKHVQQQAQEARQKIRAAEQAFNQAVRVALRQEDSTTEEAIAQVQTEIQRLRAAADEKARREAIAQTRGKTLEFGTLLATADRLSLPSIPGKSVALESFPDVPEGVVSPAVPKTRLEDRWEVALQLWASQKGYKLSESPKNARDATLEFLTWMRTHRTGL